MDLQSIKAKYLGDSFGVEFKVDIEALRERARDSLHEAERMIQNKSRKDYVESDPQWTRGWKKRQVESVKEQRRSVELAKKMLDEVSAILDKAEAKLAEVK